jgi:mono/diheme cytochrome c family protein
MMRQIFAATLSIGIIFSAVLACSQVVIKSSSNEPNSIQAGEKVFKEQCALCHSTKPGETLVGPSLYEELSGEHPRMSETRVRKIVLNGIGRMPDFKETLSSRDLDNLLAYMRTQKEPAGK